MTGNEKQFGFIPERIDAEFILGRSQEDHVRGKQLHMSCGPTESSRHSTKKSVEMGNQEERNTVSFG